MNPMNASTTAPAISFWGALRTALRHRWMNDSASHRLLAGGLGERLQRRVAASEQRHTGQVRVCVEAALPLSYLWRHLRFRVPLGQVVRERAVMLFGKLRVWDTAGNNGVLIYLLLAERGIEIVADRGLNDVITPPQWEAVLQRMSVLLREDRFEDGLTQALEEVSAMLVTHFPRDGVVGVQNAATGRSAGIGNELPDAPVSL